MEKARKPQQRGPNSAQKSPKESLDFETNKDPGGPQWMLEPAPLRLCTRCLRGRRLHPITHSITISLVHFNPYPTSFPSNMSCDSATALSFGWSIWGRPTSRPICEGGTLHLRFEDWDLGKSVEIHRKILKRSWGHKLAKRKYVEVEINSEKGCRSELYMVGLHLDPQSLWCCS